MTERRRRENLASGGFGAQVYAAADAGEITSGEAQFLVRSLLSAGLDTTVNGTGPAIFCLARFPEQSRPPRAPASCAAIDHRLDGIVAECGCNTMRATCNVYVDPAWLGERRPNSRLSCQIALTAALDGILIRLPETQI